jgi:hypothetical protein
LSRCSQRRTLFSWQLVARCLLTRIVDMWCSSLGAAILHTFPVLEADCVMLGRERAPVVAMWA